ncbi:putative alkaline shock family protein YloU [Micromonospora violae]|uniref:Putative alkaline shock family protein YloU n=1 Tax=Micromonospora violae TaxID=1278207 RepID=A0A4V2FPJ4_9ACTN|nr:Asp23/Gls24 family envelope stress response protein [Micromonospora violae]RZT80740.1 putative alkaline shock family protein YloU [Micromonospora violae]
MTDAVENAGTVPPATGDARGGTLVSDEVVEKIAGAAARSVPGVADLGGDVARFFNSILDKVGLDEAGDARRGISADVKGTSAVINVVLVIDAGRVVSDVTEAVRVAVIEAVEKYGLTVTQVNITVDDIELNQPGAAGA